MRWDVWIVRTTVREQLRLTVNLGFDLDHLIYVTDKKQTNKLQVAEGK